MSAYSPIQPPGQVWSLARQHRCNEYDALKSVVEAFLTLCECECAVNQLSHTRDYKAMNQAEQRANNARQRYDESLDRFAARSF